MSLGLVRRAVTRKAFWHLLLAGVVRRALAAVDDGLVDLERTSAFPFTFLVKGTNHLPLVKPSSPQAGDLGLKGRPFGQSSHACARHGSGSGAGLGGGRPLCVRFERAQLQK